MASLPSISLILAGRLRFALRRNTRPIDFLRDPRAKGGVSVRRALFRVAAEGNNGLKQDDDGGADPKKDRQRPVGFSFRWRDLLSPDPDNLTAVALTGLLTWASVQVVLQLFSISVAILLAALKLAAFKFLETCPLVTETISFYSRILSSSNSSLEM